MSYVDDADAVNTQQSASIKYRSVKFSTLPVAKAQDIARALVVHFPAKEIETIQQDRGGGNWSVTLKQITLAERLVETGFTLPEENIQPILYSVRLVTVTVAFVPPGTTCTNIRDALQEVAEVKHVFLLHLRDFPIIKTGKFRVILIPHGKRNLEDVLPSYTSVNGTRGALFYANSFLAAPTATRPTMWEEIALTKTTKRAMFAVRGPFVLIVLSKIDHPKILSI